MLQRVEKGVGDPQALGGKQGLDITVWCSLQVREPERGWEAGGMCMKEYTEQ